MATKIYPSIFFFSIHDSRPALQRGWSRSPSSWSMEKFLGNVDELVRGGKLNISLEERQRRICLLFTDEHIRQIVSYYHASMDKRRIRGTIPSKKETMTMDRRSGWRRMVVYRHWKYFRAAVDKWDSTNPFLSIRGPLDFQGRSLMRDASSPGHGNNSTEIVTDVRICHSIFKSRQIVFRFVFFFFF